MVNSTLREKILDLINRKIDVTDLENWLVPHLPALIQLPYSADSDVVSAIELGLTELRTGVLTEEELVNYLKQVMQEQLVLRPVIANQPNMSLNRTSSSNNTMPVVAPIDQQAENSPITVRWEMV